MLDIDHFKKYNDFLWTCSVIKCTKAAAEIIKSIRSKTDLAACYGGEEFCCAHSNKFGRSKKIAEQMILSLRKRNSHEKSDTFKFVTISVGVYTTLPKDLVPGKN